MSQEDADQLKPGIYSITFKNDWNSIAAVGKLSDGTRWMAPIDATEDSAQQIASSDWSEVRGVHLIYSKVDT